MIHICSVQHFKVILNRVILKHSHKLWYGHYERQNRDSVRKINRVKGGYNEDDPEMR